MSTERPDQDALYREANRLYWESDESVNQIGETLGLSKGVFYSLIAPLPAGLPCPGCGKEMVFPNRTARDKGFLACPGCGMEEEEAAVQSYWEGAAGAGDEEPSNGEGPLVRRAGQAVQRAVDSGVDRMKGLTPRGRILAGTALLGVAAGMIIAGVLRRR
jgi:hypothetical protein